MVGRLASGARALQDLDNVVVITPARDPKRRHSATAGIHRLVHVGTRLDQQPHDLEVTLLASDIQRRRTVVTARLVHVGTGGLSQYTRCTASNWG